MQNTRKPQYEPFAKNLKNAINNWKKKTGGNQETLADEMGIADRRSISNWINAKQFPSPENLGLLCEILEVTEDELLNKSQQEKYRYDKDFTLEIHERFRTYCEALGVSPDFLKFVKSEIPDEEFPVYSPIVLTDDEWFNSQYQRATLAEAFECDIQNEYQRRLADGKTVNLTYADYSFLKEVQDSVCEFIEYLFYKRKKEMEQDVERVNSECIIHDENMTTVKTPSSKKMLELERFRKYATQEYVEEVLKNGKNNKKR